MKGLLEIIKLNVIFQIGIGNSTIQEKAIHKGNKSTSIKYLKYQFSSVQSLSHVQLFATPWIAARQASLSITNSWSSPRLISIELVMPSSHQILWRPLLLLPPIPPSIRVFSNESTLHMRWPKYWSFSFSIIPSKEHPGPISFRMDWLGLLAVQGTIKSSPALQFKSINSSALSFLHSPTLTSIHNYWKNHFVVNLYWQSNVSAFKYQIISKSDNTEHLNKSSLNSLVWMNSSNIVRLWVSLRKILWILISLLLIKQSCEFL